MRWRNRIVAHDEIAPDQLLANPWNWRIHSQLQEQALKGVLVDIGWVRTVLVNQRTGHVVDGHLRVATAISEGQPTVPVDYVDLSDEEEKAILATLDPLAGMATTDVEKQAELLKEIHATGSEALKATLGSLKPVSFMARSSKTPVYGVVIECQTATDVALLLERLRGEGLQCRTL
jgi:ParB-like chromosome segregation protein Spo0J